ncbi:hypothetical protein KA478_02890 [Patescibacteria group bacterium]|nr:hypothetical protein [Patescibacteria group bacterium]
METISQRASGGKKSLLGVVPYTLDKKYSNVSSMLSESGQFSQMIHESAAVIKDKVVGLIA